MPNIVRYSKYFDSQDEAVTWAKKCSDTLLKHGSEGYVVLDKNRFSIWRSINDNDATERCMVAKNNPAILTRLEYFAEQGWEVVDSKTLKAKLLDLRG